MLDGRDELTRLEQAIVRARVEPRVPATENLDVERASPQVPFIHVRDLQLSARGGCDRRRDVAHVGVVEVETGDGVVALRRGWLLFERYDAVVLVELHDAVPLGIADVVCKNGRALLLLARCSRDFLQAIAIEQVVTQDECRGGAVQEVAPEYERLSEPVRTGLRAIT